jgi:hypothetical protein
MSTLKMIRLKRPLNCEFTEKMLHNRKINTESIYKDRLNDPEAVYFTHIYRRKLWKSRV